MNERWKYSDFKLSEVVLLIISVDGCFERLEEFFNFVMKVTDKKPFGAGRDVINYKARSESVLPKKFHDSLQWGSLYAIPADDLEAKSHEAQRIHKALIKEFTKLNSNSGSIRSQLSIEYEISLVELHQWLNENCFTDMAEQFKPIVSLSQSETNDSKSRLNESEYWNKLEKIAVKAIDEYPNWAKDKKKIRKTGNLQSWLEENICNEQRAEPEIIKRILTDIYNI